MNNTLIVLCVTLNLLGSSLWVSAQETLPSSPEEQPSELTMEQVCEQSADADGIVGKAREAYMANCLASLTNMTPEEEESPQDTDNKNEKGKSSEDSVKSAAVESSQNKEQDFKLPPPHEKHSNESKK